MLKQPDKPPQTKCECLIPDPFEHNHKVYCRKCGFKINDSLDQVIIIGDSNK